MVLILVAGCGRHLNPAWCAEAGHDDPACSELADAGASRCAESDDCAGAPCLPSGVCADPGAVLHASPDGAGTACTRTAPCLLQAAIAAATPARNAILLEPATYTGAVIIDRSVQIAGNRATLVAGPAGATVTVTGDVTAGLGELSITGSIDASGVACASPSATLRLRAVRITNNRQGVTSACALTLERSLVAANPDGALAITAGAIDIHDNFIVHNGDDRLGVANVAIAGGVTGALAFNTVAYNDARPNTVPGVTCGSTAVIAGGNLITDNTQRGGFGASQVAGVCDFSQSYTAPGTGGNDLAWANVAASDFHLTAASTAVIDSQLVTCDGRVDFDGRPRPLGRGCELGADELEP